MTAEDAIRALIEQMLDDPDSYQPYSGQDKQAAFRWRRLYTTHGNWPVPGRGEEPRM